MLGASAFSKRPVSLENNSGVWHWGNISFYLLFVLDNGLKDISADEIKLGCVLIN